MVGGGGENINSVPLTLVHSFQSSQYLRPTKVLTLKMTGTQRFKI